MSSAAWEVRRFASLASTNTYLLDEARRGAPAGLVAVADHQRAGRGRLGRRWEAPAGSALLVSILLRPLCPPDELFACTAAVALATADACAAVGGVAAGVKWPNDLVVDDRKLAGVLAESDAAAPGGRPGSVAVVVGVGCNVRAPGPDPEVSTSLDAEAPSPVDPEALLHGMLERLGHRVGPLDVPAGRRRTIDDLRRRCATLGRRVRVERLGDEPIVGIAADLSPDGRLVVVTDDGAVSVTSGDVVHLRPAPSGAEDDAGSHAARCSAPEPEPPEAVG